jgi:uncharacterized integral membrane protein
MSRRSPLDDRQYAKLAWARYWRLMRWMLAVTVTVAVFIMVTLWWHNDGSASIHFYIATAAAVVGAMMLTAALMGLVFLSSGTGHDEAIEDPFEDEADRND